MQNSFERPCSRQAHVWLTGCEIVLTTEANDRKSELTSSTGLRNLLTSELHDWMAKNFFVFFLQIELNGLGMNDWSREPKALIDSAYTANIFIEKSTVTEFRNDSNI